MKPNIIILNEPTAGLDPMGVSELMHLLLKIKKENGISIIIVIIFILWIKGKWFQKGIPKLFLKKLKL